MKKTFKFRVSDKKRLRYTVTVEINLETKENGLPVFTASATVGNGGRYERGGQCFDDILKYYTFNNPTDYKIFLNIYDIWKRNHLNNLNAGTEKQMTALKNGYESYCSGREITDKFESQCDYLKSIDLYVDILEGGMPYKYGSGWIYRAISEKDLLKIDELLHYE